MGKGRLRVQRGFAGEGLDFDTGLVVAREHFNPLPADLGEGSPRLE
jgi:hypothetical protein